MVTYLVIIMTKMVVKKPFWGDHQSYWFQIGTPVSLNYYYYLVFSYSSQGSALPIMQSTN